MDSFQAKIGWKRMKKRENKNYRSVLFKPDEQQKASKQQQENSKNQKIPSRVHFKPKQVGKGRERERIKIIVPFRSYPALNRKLKKIAKKIKKLKNITGWKRMRQRENKKYCSVPFQPDAKQKIPKQQQKNSKN